MIQPFKFFHTIKYLKWSQLYYRVHRKLVKPAVGETFSGEVPHRSESWVSSTLYDEKLTENYQATFLNFSNKLELPSDWNSESHSKLWTYNLHYFEDLLASNAPQKRSFHIDLINRWIDENPVGKGNGWEPYPLSLRISNILKAWLGGLPLESSHFESLYAQASYLSNDLEKHLLGNHYFVNLKALLFAGVVFDNARWKGIATEGLLKEIPEQILDDGANFELTPMYHALILVDMLDMFNLAKSYPSVLPDQFRDLLRGNIQKMLKFLQLMAHPDGGVSFFNDSVDGIAPTKSRIEEYAVRLGFILDSIDVEVPQVFDLAASGYMVGLNRGAKLIFDAAKVGPDYIPGHAHADTLSFELSIGDERVIVNSGISQYGLGPERERQRSTKAHSTVEIDGQNSSEVWSGFRVARRARPFGRAAELSDGEIRLLASHDGYRRLKGCNVHTRELQLGNHSLSLTDTITNTFQSAISRFYFHPSLVVSLTDGVLKVRGQSFEMTADLNGQKATLSNANYHPAFGVSIENRVLELDLQSSSTTVDFYWNVL